MAEIKIGFFVRACLDRRIASVERMIKEVVASLTSKNSKPTPIKWQFTNEGARIRLHNPHPSI